MAKKARKSPRKPVKKSASNRSKERCRLTVHLSTELTERAKNAAFWTPGASLSGLVHDGLLDQVERLEQKNGGPFKTRSGNLVSPGRPVEL